jgi:hypothetical protein
MSARLLMAVLVLAVVGSSASRAAEQPAIADFRFTVAADPNTQEVVLRCSKGCAWETLTFSCNHNGVCSMPVDQYGTADHED